jgi:hypothetical protein
MLSSDREVSMFFLPLMTSMTTTPSQG